MGYTCYGAVYLTENAQSHLPSKVKEFLDNRWDKSIEHENVWEFNNWNWSNTLETMDLFERYYNSLKDISTITESDYDVVIIVEDSNSKYVGLDSTSTKFIIPQGYTIIEEVQNEK